MKLKKFAVRKNFFLPQSFSCTNALAHKNPSIENKDSSNISKNGLLLRELNVSSEAKNVQQYDKPFPPSKSACDLHQGHKSTQAILNNVTLREEVGKLSHHTAKPIPAKEIEQYHKRVFSNRERKLKVIPAFKKAIKNSAYTSLNEIIQKTYFMDKTVRFMFNQVIDYKFKMKKKFYDEELMKKNKQLRLINKSRNMSMSSLVGWSKAEKKDTAVNGVYVVKKNHSADTTNVTLHSKYPRLNASSYSYKCKPMIYF